jgi:SH3-like domain-containing protein
MDAMRIAALSGLALGAGLVLLIAGCSLPRREETACATPQTRPSPSGYCVPRWLSLKRGAALARRGPGFDYPPLFTYRARGLPVQVVAETAEWRRICDPDGGAFWIHRSQVDGRRTVLTPRQARVSLLARPQNGARTVAQVNPRTLGDLERCQGGWCRIRAGGQSGWVRQDEVWGTQAVPQCR